MNFFYTNSNLVAAAADLCDLRLNKMITETAQMLSTYVYFKDHGHYITDDRFMRPAYVHHPCTQWVMESSGNFDMMTEYMSGLRIAWIGNHKSFRVLDACEAMGYILDDPTPVPSVTPGFTSPDVVQNYRDYMSKKWDNDKRPPTWTHFNQQPEWYS